NDAGEEQQGDRRGDLWLAGKGGGGGEVVPRFVRWAKARSHGLVPIESPARAVPTRDGVGPSMLLVGTAHESLCRRGTSCPRLCPPYTRTSTMPPGQTPPARIFRTPTPSARSDGAACARNARRSSQSPQGPHRAACRAARTRRNAHPRP